MTLREIFDQTLGVLGFEDPDKSTTLARKDALVAIRAALQTMQLAGEEYYAKEELDVSLVIGTSFYELAKEVQSVLEHPRVGSRTLKKLTSRSRFDDFGPLFLGQTSRTLIDGTPLAYFVDSQRDTGDEDSVKITIRLAPAPDASATMVVPVIKEPPVYTATELCNGTIPPVPHEYHETLLLPLCKWNVTSSFYFDKYDQLPILRAGRRDAMTALGLARPTKEEPFRAEPVRPPEPQEQPPQ